MAGTPTVEIRSGFGTRGWLAPLAGAALLAAAPLVLGDFRLALLGQFLAFAILALGLDLLWGYTGLLSLGHGVFFGLGAYCLAMHMKLETSHGGLPDFMQLYGDMKTLPWFWVPFRSATFSVAASVLLPAILATLLGYLTFRSRVRGVFFSILSQALSVVVVTLFVSQIAYTGGTNGLTQFTTVLGHPLDDPANPATQHHMTLALYWVTLGLLTAAFAGCRTLMRLRFGKILMAIRDGENRTRFFGYDPVAYKVFIYALSAALAGVAGALFVPQNGIISPSQMDIVHSIRMVLWVALGGRGTLIGAVLGAVVVNAAENSLSESYPGAWSFLLGGAFLVVVLFMPRGVVGAVEDLRMLWTARRWPLGSKRSLDRAVNAESGAVEPA